MKNLFFFGLVVGVGAYFLLKKEEEPEPPAKEPPKKEAWQIQGLNKNYV